MMVEWRVLILDLLEAEPGQCAGDLVQASGGLLKYGSIFYQLRILEREGRICGVRKTQAGPHPIPIKVYSLAGGE